METIYFEVQTLDNWNGWETVRSFLMLESGLDYIQQLRMQSRQEKTIKQYRIIKTTISQEVVD